MTVLSVAECAKMVGVSNRTIQNKIKAGKLSATRDNNGYYKIDSSEFIRVYPDAKKQEKKQNNSRTKNEEENKLEIQKNELMAQELTFIKRENEALKAQLNKTESREKDLIDTLKSNTRLLEHQSNSKRKKVFGIF